MLCWVPTYNWRLQCRTVPKKLTVFARNLICIFCTECKKIYFYTKFLLAVPKNMLELKCGPELEWACGIEFKMNYFGMWNCEPYPSTVGHWDCYWDNQGQNFHENVCDCGNTKKFQFCQKHPSLDVPVTYGFYSEILFRKQYKQEIMHLAYNPRLNVALHTRIYMNTHP